ncbi:hypothetical protein [Halobellus rarus]|uniref:Uncharacterized protein n=1 Tax=Halobellus rarus TaxID=1126237 RepID=A0ABD6CJ85_9EURY|nr:hypothetical protein [Halobellus rarus]
MIRRRHVLLVVALLTATALVTSSGAFSATAAERGVDIGVADDRDAYVGFEKTVQSDGNATVNVSVTRRDGGNETVNETQGDDGNATANETPENNGNATANETQGDDGDETASVDVTVVNQFPAGTELATVEITVGTASADLAPLAPGERATHTFSSAPCGASIRIEASGDGVAVTFERSVTCN